MVFFNLSSGRLACRTQRKLGNMLPTKTTGTLRTFSMNSLLHRYQQILSRWKWRDSHVFLEASTPFSFWSYTDCRSFCPSCTAWASFAIKRILWTWIAFAGSCLNSPLSGRMSLTHPVVPFLICYFTVFITAIKKYLLAHAIGDFKLSLSLYSLSSLKEKLSVVHFCPSLKTNYSPLNIKDT